LVDEQLAGRQDDGLAREGGRELNDVSGHGEVDRFPERSRSAVAGVGHADRGGFYRRHERKSDSQSCKEQSPPLGSIHCFSRWQITKKPRSDPSTAAIGSYTQAARKADSGHSLDPVQSCRVDFCPSLLEIRAAMFLNPEDIQRMERLHGVPVEDSVSFEMGEKEWGVLKRSQTKGRTHDVTLYVRRGEDLAVIAKHGYPHGIYRAPSGGVHPGETMEEGIAREVMEEMGVEIRLGRYVLRMQVEFSRPAVE